MLRWKVTTDCVVFFLAVFGASSMLKMLAKDIERLDRKPFNCPLCSGFWIGLLLFFIWRIFPVHSSPIIYAFAGAGICWGIHRMITGDY